MHSSHSEKVGHLLTNGDALSEKSHKKTFTTIQFTQFMRVKDEANDDESSLSIEESQLPQRFSWGHSFEYFLSTIGYSVGMGNMWRFPFLCMKSGGGAFLIPYFICLCICGIPLFLMESSLGQSTGLSAIRIYELLPFFGGVGWCMVFASGVISMYYNVILAWVIYFIGMSFRWEVPWKNCDNDWNTPNCFSNHPNQTSNFTGNGMKRTAAQEFWLNNVLTISDDINDMGTINWKLLISFIIAWVLTFACICRGIKSAGKVVYVTATAPYVFITIMFIRGVTLPGAWYGLKLYLVPKWELLLDVNVWVNAAVQVFYSLGPAWGGLIAFASFNKYDHNVCRDAIIVPIVCGCTSFYGGLAIFAVLGNTMYLTKQYELDDLMSQGPGLAFIAYPQALANLPLSGVWSVVFFSILLMIGIDSQFAFLETVLTNIIDRFPKVLGHRKVLFTLCVCILQFLLGIVFVTQGGFYYFKVMDYYSTTFSIVMVGFFECIAISYGYGSRRLLADIRNMTKRKVWLSWWWLLEWYLLAPLCTMVVIVSTFILMFGGISSQLEKFPPWAIVIGWMFASLSFMPLPIFALWAIYQHGFDAKKLFFPHKDWEVALRQRQLACEKHSKPALES